MRPTTPRRPRVVVIFGGRSSEHGVSCVTAAKVLGAIDAERYEVTGVGITTDGAWVLEDLADVDVPAGELPSVRPDRPPFAWESLRDFDVAMPLLHGPWGEDGTVQGLLEVADVRYVGAGVLASSVGMDKPFTKTVFAAGGLPQIPYVTVLPRQWRHERDRVLARVRALGLPVFVKPARAGSSSGVGLVDSWDALTTAIETAREFDPKVIVESAARGKRELECGVLEQVDGPPLVSVVGEVAVRDPAHTFYDFESKYLDGTSENVIPADVSETLSDRIRTYAAQAFSALGCEGLARVDFFVTDDGLVINEINTLPGMTPFSMFPQVWESTGWSWAEVVDHLLQVALHRPLGLR